MKEVNKIVKRGYLKGDFKFFHLCDKNDIQFAAHGHDFYKIIIFISGDVNYLIEGRSYKLEPWDVLFVGCNEIHKPFISGDKVYERIILWINPGFLRQNSTEKCNLFSAFDYAEKEKSNLLKISSEDITKIKQILNEFEKENSNIEFGSELLRRILIIEMIVNLTRKFFEYKSKNIDDNSYDKNMIEIIEYINNNITIPMSVEEIASKFYMSKYHLMHSFKKETGYTVHNYILQKRLILSSNLIKQGTPILAIPCKCGFVDYSNFVRAYKKMYGVSPKQYYKEYKSN